MKEQLSEMKVSLIRVEMDVSDIKGNLYRMERMGRQMDKSVARIDRLEVEMEMLR